MFILGAHLALRCDSCGAQLGLGRTTIEAARRRLPSGWRTLDKGKHSCSLCSMANPLMFNRR